jgi:hypothetical protein
VEGRAPAPATKGSKNIENWYQQYLIKHRGARKMLGALGNLSSPWAKVSLIAGRAFVQGRNGSVALV